MNELIPIRIGEIAGAQQQTVNARDLHAFLGVGKDFTTWIKAQIDRARLGDGRDFVEVYAQKGENPTREVFPQKGVNPSGGRPRAEYHLTIDAAKHVAMMSGTDKGFEVRDYFIECERRARESPAVDPMRVLNDPTALRGLLATYSEKVIALEERVAEQAPVVDAFKRLASTDGSFCSRDSAKVLQVRPVDLKGVLLSRGWIYPRPGKAGYLAYQDKIQAGYMVHKGTTVHREDGTEKFVEQPRITTKGLQKLALILGTTLRLELAGNAPMKSESP